MLSGLELPTLLTAICPVQRPRLLPEASQGRAELERDPGREKVDDQAPRLGAWGGSPHRTLQQGRGLFPNKVEFWHSEGQDFS